MQKEKIKIDRFIAGVGTAGIVDLAAKISQEVSQDLGPERIRRLPPSAPALEKGSTRRTLGAVPPGS